jgi:hypothetical protein
MRVDLRFKNRHLKLLKGLDLRSLNLGDTGITDAGVKQLRAFPNLESLDFGFLDITDAALGELPSLKKLRSLDLACPSITDVGVRKLRASTCWKT